MNNPSSGLIKCLTCPMQVVPKYINENGGKCYCCSPPTKPCEGCGVLVTFGKFFKHKDTCTLNKFNGIGITIPISGEEC